MPEISAPTSGAVVGVAVKVSDVEDPVVDPMPEPCDVKIDALPCVIRTFIGPLPTSATAIAAIGNCVTLFGRTCARAAVVKNSAAKRAKTFFKSAPHAAGCDLFKRTR